MSEVSVALRAAFGSDRVREHVPLSTLTTFQVGGPADVLLETRGTDELVTALKIARSHGVPVMLLGGGSNLLVGDRGVRGLVIRPRGGTVSTIGDRLVRADAAVTINGLVRWAITHGCGGLEGWAGTPGTVGGAVFGNAHWRGQAIGDLIDSVRLLKRDGTQLHVTADRMEFAYDYSRLKRTDEVVAWVAFRVVCSADPDALREVARASLAFRKRTQPLAMPSAGCIFMNPDPVRDRVPDGIPPSAGALLDRAGLKGAAVGGARVSTVHANFIVNEGNASAADIRTLIEHCRSTVFARFGITLRDEIMSAGEF